MELFRIVVMMLIIAHHYVVNSGLIDEGGPIFSDPMSGRSLFLLLLGAWGKTGINCFVLISGYFMCKSHITAKKFVKLLFEVEFYRMIIATIFWITAYEPFTLKSFLKALLPIRNIGSGFPSCYIVFFLFIPFLNVLVNHINERMHIKLLLLCAFTYIFMGTVPFFSVTMNYVSWFMVLYFIASYIRLYPKKLFVSTRFWGYLSVVSLALSAVSVVACAWLGTKIGRNMAYEFVSDSNTLLAVTTGVSTFGYALNKKIPYSRWINTLAGSTFGVLLFHASGTAMPRWLWRDTLNNVGMYGSKWMPVHAIGSVLLIYVVGTVIDYLRIEMIEKPLFRLWDLHWEKIEKRYRKIEENLCAKLNIL